MTGDRHQHCAEGNHGWCTGQGASPADLLLFPQEDEVEIRIPQPEAKYCGCACHARNDTLTSRDPSPSRRAAPGCGVSPLSGSPVLGMGRKGPKFPRVPLPLEGGGTGAVPPKPGRRRA